MFTLDDIRFGGEESKFNLIFIGFPDSSVHAPAPRSQEEGNGTSIPSLLHTNKIELLELLYGTYALYAVGIDLVTAAKLCSCTKFLKYLFIFRVI